MDKISVIMIVKILLPMLIMSISPVLSDKCCNKVFLSSSDVLEKEQGALLGKYQMVGTHNGKPYFMKRFQDNEYYLYYRNKDPSSNTFSGWIVGPVLNASIVNIVTRNAAIGCPDGITGAYDRDVTHDPTFLIECLSEEVKVDCCPRVTVSATGSVLENQGARIGTYNRDGDFNGYPAYFLDQYSFQSYLYYRKRGLSTDGWIIDGSIGEDTFSITTRNTGFCPNEIVGGYDRDVNYDDSFTITCTTELPPTPEGKPAPPTTSQDLSSHKTTARGRDGKQVKTSGSESISQRSHFVVALLISMLFVVRLK